MDWSGARKALEAAPEACKHLDAGPEQAQAKELVKRLSPEPAPDVPAAGPAPGKEPGNEPGKEPAPPEGGR